MDPITTSPLEAANLGNPAAPAFDSTFPSQVPANPGFGQPVIPPNLNIPLTPNDDFATQLAAARSQSSAPAQTPTPARQPGTGNPPQPADSSTQTPSSATGGATATEDPSQWTPPSRNTKKIEQWNDLKEAFAKEKADLKRQIEDLRTGKIAPDGDLTKLPFERLAAHPEIAKLKQERDEFFEDIRLIRAEKDPEFIAKFTPPP